MKELAAYQEWRQRNLAEERVSIALEMLQEGRSPGIIAKVTELSIAQIQNLQKQLASTTDKNQSPSGKQPQNQSSETPKPPRKLPKVDPARTIPYMKDGA
jgi:hypothetical protein